MDARGVLARSLSLALAAACLALFPPRAEATNITLTGLGMGQNVPLIANGTAETGWAGQIQVTVFGQPVILYCVDLFTNIGYGTYGSTITSAAAWPAYQRAGWLYNTYAASVVNNDQASALQLALWDVVHDNGDGLATGMVILEAAAPAGLRTLAQQYIAASQDKISFNVALFHNVSLTSGAPQQTLIGAYYLATPEPATWAMVACCALPLALRRRNGRR